MSPGAFLRAFLRAYMRNHHARLDWHVSDQSSSVGVVALHVSGLKPLELRIAGPFYGADRARLAREWADRIETHLNPPDPNPWQLWSLPP